MYHSIDEIANKIAAMNKMAQSLLITRTHQSKEATNHDLDSIIALARDIVNDRDDKNK